MVGADDGHRWDGGRHHDWQWKWFLEMLGCNTVSGHTRYLLLTFPKRIIHLHCESTCCRYLWHLKSSMRPESSCDLIAVDAQLGSRKGWMFILWLPGWKVHRGLPPSFCRGTAEVLVLIHLHNIQGMLWHHRQRFSIGSHVSWQKPFRQQPRAVPEPVIQAIHRTRCND